MGMPLNLALALLTAQAVSGAAPRTALIQKVTPLASWSDLKVSPRQERALRNLVEMARRERSSRPPACAAVIGLFPGANVRAKAAAAGAVAADLGRELFRVELGQVMGKYIGETEKNLDRVFSEAKAADAVLLFDEADALFGRRTRVGDAHDRYANQETSHLLRRIENHDGLVIVATNTDQHLDRAFRRCRRAVVTFARATPK